MNNKFYSKFKVYVVRDKTESKFVSFNPMRNGIFGPSIRTLAQGDENGIFVRDQIQSIAR